MGDLQKAAETELLSYQRTNERGEKIIGTAFEDTFIWCGKPKTKTLPFLGMEFSLPRLQLGTAKSAAPWETHSRFAAITFPLRDLGYRLGKPLRGS